MKVYKIHKNYDFRVVYNRGRAFSNNLFVIHVFKNRRNCNEFNRLGISISKKVGKSVTRNKIRRRVYEIYRLNLDKLKKGYDIVFVARSNSKDKNYSDIEKSVCNLLRKSLMINEEK